MPVVFIHGVATRTSEKYEQEVSARRELIRRLLVEPMAAINPLWKDMEIVSPYWGDLGVRHYWAQATVPKVHALEDLGPEGEATASDLEVAELLAGGGGTAGGGLENLGGETPLRDAWTADPQRTVEAFLAPLIHGERSVLQAEDLPQQDSESEAQTAGDFDGIVLAAAAEVAADAALMEELRHAPSDDAFLKSFKDAISLRTMQLAGHSAIARTVMIPDLEPLAGQLSGTRLETLGPDALGRVKVAIGAIIDRVQGAPARIGSLVALDRFRDGLHYSLTQFMGDVFIYLLQRGDAGTPGPIVERVRHAISDVQSRHPNEPLVILTHSMGGNILYDLLTTYDPSLKVDLWVSAGGQVGQFEEMKIFRASAITGPPAPPAPDKVAALSGRVRTWLNVYDPADILSFLVEPVFTDEDTDVRIRDLKFKSGVSALNAHGAYFTRPSFYRLIWQEL